jgi:Zn-dependent peptidase ImmA (M78 family)
MTVVNPDILIWARESAGLSPEAAVKKLGLNPTKAMSSLERLDAMESGIVEPTRPMLLKMAQQYRRPLVVFYMSERPLSGEQVKDFRNVPDRDARFDALIAALVRDVKGRQAAVREILLEDDEVRSLQFVGSMKISDGVENVLKAIQDTIEIDVSSFRSQTTPESGFALLRARAEAAGIFVLLMGDLGSHHTAIDAEAFRGFALADDIAPFVVVNDQDARTAWSFTLIHELAHIWLGASGVSGKVSDQKIEKFCSDIASSFLLPHDELALINVTRKTEQAEAARVIGEFARERHLSSTMVAYALSRADLITTEMWRSLAGLFVAQWRNNRKAEKEKKKESSGPDYYVVRRHRLGRALLDVVSRGMSEGSLTPTRASQVLGVKPRSVAPLLSGKTMASGRAA